MSYLFTCTCACCICRPEKAGLLQFVRSERCIECSPSYRMLETAAESVAQCTAGSHEEELRLFEALERMPVRHRSVSALALAQALTMAPDVGHLGKGLRFVLVVSTHLGKSGHVNVPLCYSKGINRLCCPVPGHSYEACALKINAI